MTVAKAAASKLAVKVEDAVKKAERTLKGNNDPSFPKPSVAYLVKKDGTAAHAHVFQVRSDQEGTWYEAFVDALSDDSLFMPRCVAISFQSSSNLPSSS